MTRPVPLQPSHGVTQPELAVHTRAVRRTLAGGGGGDSFTRVLFFSHCLCSVQRFHTLLRDWRAFQVKSSRFFYKILSSHF